MRGSVTVWGVVGLSFLAQAGLAQDPGKAVPATVKQGGTPNINMLAHVDVHPGSWKAADIEMEQDPDRPYVYVCGFVNFDTKIYDVRDPVHPKLVYTWTIENPELHRGSARWMGSTSRSEATTTTPSRCSSCRGVPTRTWGR